MKVELRQMPDMNFATLDCFFKNLILFLQPDNRALYEYIITLHEGYADLCLFCFKYMVL